MASASPFLDAADGHVGDEAGPRVAQRFGGFGVLGHFDDARAERLLLRASTARNRPPATRVLGTVAVSTTLIHGVHFMDPKYSAAALISSSVIALAMAIIDIGVGLARVGALAIAVLEIGHLLDEIRDRITGDGRILRAALAVRVVA